MREKNLLKRTRIEENKTLLTIAAILLLAISTLPMTTLTVGAHTPPWSIPTYAYLAVSPDPIGVGQPAFVIMWIDKPPPTAAGSAGGRWTGYKVAITLPDGTLKTLGPFTSDATSSTFTTYTPTKVGTYKFVFTFPEQIATLNNPINGQPGNPNNAYIGDTYLTSNATTYLTVQEAPVVAPPNYPLPKTYWTRPIEAENTGWITIASNYLNPFGAAYTYGSERLQPFGAAPSSAHVMWTKPISFGGVVGGLTSNPAATIYSGLSYETKFNSPLIICGCLYYGLPLGNNGGGGGYVCVDLRTGQQVWWQNFTVNPSFGQLYDYESMNQHGVEPNGYLWATSGTTWMAYDAFSGNWLFNETAVPSGTNVYGPNGEICRFVINLNNHWLALWNNTCEQQGLHGSLGTGSSAYQWRPVGKSVNMTNAYSWNVTIPTITSAYGTNIAIRYTILDDILLGSFGNPGTGCTVFALSLKSNSKGVLLWSKDYPAPAGNITRSFEAVDPVNRVFTMSDKETMQWSGFSLDDGNQLWGPLGQTRAFNYYPTVGSGGVSQVGFCAYGKLYTDGYGGELFCYDTKTGELLWKYNNTYSGVETPWGLYPLFTAAIADGKIYLFNNEHSPNDPQYKGERARCLDANTGEELWTLLSWAGVGGFADQGWPVADGYIAYLNTYDMQVYCIGKGPSQTTVTATPGLNNAVTIQGTVNDISSGAKQKMQTGEFPIVPAMSDESMGPWMEYIFMQKPKPTNTTGVNVHIVAYDPSGTLQDLGFVKSDANGKFGMSFKPKMEGTYYISAKFEGSNSYYASEDSTYLAVGAAALPSVVPTPTLEPTIQPSTSTPIATPTTTPSPAVNVGGGPNTALYVGITAIVIIAVIAAVALILRRRK